MSDARRPEDLQVPTTSGGDAALAIARVALGAIPVAGGVAVELFQWWVKAPYAQRMDQWMQQVGETLQWLVSKANVRLEDLQADPKFVDTVMQASYVAMQNTNEDKCAALRNAILNSGLPSAPEESKRQMFLNLLDSFTPLHLHLLTLYDDPEKWFVARGLQWRDEYIGKLSGDAILAAALPEWAKEMPFLETAWHDLSVAGLVHMDQVRMLTADSANKRPPANLLRAQFLAFIREPTAVEGVGNV